MTSQTNERYLKHQSRVGCTANIDEGFAKHLDGAHDRSHTITSRHLGCLLGVVLGKLHELWGHG